MGIFLLFDFFLDFSITALISVKISLAFLRRTSRLHSHCFSSSVLLLDAVAHGGNPQDRAASLLSIDSQRSCPSSLRCLRFCSLSHDL